MDQYVVLVASMGLSPVVISMRHARGGDPASLMPSVTLAKG
jgi:hypothetical protein